MTQPRDFELEPRLAEGAEKRRSQRIALRVPIVAIGTDRHGHAFGELTQTVVVNAHGALIELRAELEAGQRLLLRNRFSGERQPCRVIWFRRPDEASGEQGRAAVEFVAEADAKNQAAVEFVTPAPHFWGVEFPPEDWNVAKMRAALLKEFGMPLEVADVPRPEPHEGEILIRVEACGICHSDLHMAYGEWPDVAKRMQMPAVLGHEAVGRVVALGKGVTEWREGDRVGVGWLSHTCGECEHCRDGAENVCLKREVTSVEIQGGYAEYMPIRASYAVAVPESLDAAAAAPLFCAGLTVFHACRNIGILPQEVEGIATWVDRAAAWGEGRIAAVFGVGGLGQYAIQLARLAGWDVIACDMTDEKLELARSLGAARTVRADAPDAKKILRERGGPHAAIVTATAKAAYDLAFRTLRRRGTLGVVGLPKDDLTFFADDLVVTEAHIIGSAVGTRAEMREVLALAAAGHLRSEAEAVGLADVNSVYERMRAGTLRARAVVTF